MDEAKSLRVASRIHFILLRHLGTGIDIGTMLAREAYAREVLFVCDGSEDAELRELALQFRDASGLPTRGTPVRPRRVRSAVATSAPDPAPVSKVDPAWGRDTSGFGYTLGPVEAGEPAPRSGWLSPSRWLSRPRPAR